VIFCYQVDGCSCEEILADVTDQYVWKAYHVHKQEEGKLLPAQTVFLTYESSTIPE
jgi:hypothetical protein